MDGDAQGSELHEVYHTADSDEFSRRFQLNPATDSERSQPGVLMIPAG